jgi:hypothetical protein
MRTFAHATVQKIEIVNQTYDKLHLFDTKTSASTYIFFYGEVTFAAVAILL